MTETKADSESVEPQYIYVSSKSRTGLMDEMNSNALDGYVPVWPSHKPLLFKDDDYFMIMEYHEPIDTDEKKLVKAELSQLIMNAEFQVVTINAKLEGMKADLNANTDWKKASEEQENPIKTVGDKAGYILKLTTEIQAQVDSYKSYLSHLKRLEKISELPEGYPPWIKLKEPEKSGYPDNSIELGGIMYCQDMKNSCSKCLKCETKESE